jgi:hypothetical protein
MAAAAGAASGVDASEASSLAHFSHSASEVKVHDRHLLHLRVEDENTLSHAELEEQKFFSECELSRSRSSCQYAHRICAGCIPSLGGSSMKTIIIAMHCVDGTIHRHLETRKNIARLVSSAASSARATPAAQLLWRSVCDHMCQSAL